MNWGFIAAVMFTAWNIYVFALYGLDKAAAKHGKRRISEKALILSAVFMGAVGALAGMYKFHHKTNHTRFKIGVPLLLILNAIIAVIIIYIMPRLNIFNRLLLNISCRL